MAEQADSKAWSEGHEAAMDGRKLDDNPHPPGSLQHRSWESGWHTSVDPKAEQTKQDKDSA